MARGPREFHKLSDDEQAELLIRILEEGRWDRYYTYSALNTKENIRKGCKEDVEYNRRYRAAGDKFLDYYEHERVVQETQRRIKEHYMNSRDGQVQSDENSIEKEIRDKGLNAPRLSPELIDQSIVDEAYYVFPGTSLTVCCLTLRNGFHVTGESAAASPENFDRAIGEKIAKRNARDKIWSLEGYLLKDRLHNRKGS